MLRFFLKNQSKYINNNVKKSMKDNNHRFVSFPSAKNTAKGDSLKRSSSMVDGTEEGQKYAATPYHMRPALRVTPTGKNLLATPTFNKGAAFGLGERDRMGLRGLLPPRKLTMKQQIDRTEAQLAKEDSMIRKNVYLRDLFCVCVLRSLNIINHF